MSFWFELSSLMNSSKMHLNCKLIILSLVCLLSPCSSQEEEEADRPVINEAVNLISNTFTCATRMRHFDGPCSSSLPSSFSPKMGLFTAEWCRQLADYNECIRSKLQADLSCRQARQLMLKTIDDDYSTKCARFDAMETHTASVL